jgi:hypothetical protein
MKEVKKTAARKAAPKAVKAPAAPKAVAAKKPAVKKAAAPAKPAVSPEQRYRMIEEAAYYIAERHGFSGDSTYFWSLAEAEINAKLT